ncbi:ABC transporter permease [Aeromicrobium wangtongii]|uniref:ABC transporter permease n=1 Tax=Aeromicrobium wangtongii TaxID=2969247 RepID=UPI00201765D1|nr:ABC transporter permease [Aeromicrobium wangtongii]MCL3819400.1 ABC transporter permease [Aeromicrobium wangtongii]
MTTTNEKPPLFAAASLFARTRTRRRPTLLRRIPMIVSLTWIVVLVIFAATYQWLGLPDPTESDYAAIATGPLSPDHLLGTDTIGRDMLARLIVGARVSLAVGFFGALAATVIGTVLGLLAGFYGGIVSRLINALTDVLLAFPGIVALIALSVFIGPGLKLLIIGFGLVAAPQVARVARAVTLMFAQRDFVTAARSMGFGNGRILFRDVLPNVIGPVVAYGTVLMAVAIVAEGSLSFLGLGVPAPQSSWGSLMADGRSAIQQAPHIVLLPAAFMFLTLMAIYFLAEELNRKFDIKEAAL